MGEKLWEATARVFGFNPAEKRGSDGKWIVGGTLLKRVSGKIAEANSEDRKAERRTLAQRKADVRANARSKELKKARKAIAKTDALAPPEHPLSGH